MASENYRELAHPWDTILRTSKAEFLPRLEAAEPDRWTEEAAANAFGSDSRYVSFDRTNQNNADLQGDTEEWWKPPVDLDLRSSAILPGQ